MNDDYRVHGYATARSYNTSMGYRVIKPSKVIERFEEEERKQDRYQRCKDNANASHEKADKRLWLYYVGREETLTRQEMLDRLYQVIERQVDSDQLVLSTKDFDCQKLFAFMFLREYARHCYYESRDLFIQRNIPGETKFTFYKNNDEHLPNELFHGKPELPNPHERKKVSS